MIWDQCQGTAQIRPIQGTLFRLVESQEQIATLGFVDTLDEQALLEELLESVKPNYPLSELQSQFDKLHYLLKTPFRYPPLKWGSRFGRITENSIFYGGLSKDVTLAEAAYYRFVFWYSMGSKPVKEKIRTEHTLFSVDYATNKGIQLQHTPFDNYKDKLAHTRDYSASQTIGTRMREAEVEAFEYASARLKTEDASQGYCVGLFDACAFKQHKPKDSNQWLCELGANEVSFKQLGQAKIHRFPLTSFLVNGELPLPA